MGHTNINAWAEKHDRHEQRSDTSNVRGDMKKHGAGAGNWGMLGDEALEERRKDISSEQTNANQKLQLLSTRQFTRLRRWSQ
ncbi:unnamed protein product [Umbelopsis ramanniana]